jgi:glycosyltransferase involved in cell wall biosynthesis
VGTTTIDPDLLDTFSAEDKIQALREAPSLKILFLSRLVKEKGIYETLKAFQTLRKAYPTAELVVAGDGPEYANLCMQTVRMEGVTLTGHVAGNEKNELLSTSHIYCLPSYTEGLPTSVLEAMAFGIPVVTTAVGGLRDFFKDPEMGSFVDLEKPGDLADKLGQLLANKDRRMAVGKFNLKFAQAHLMAPTVATKLKALCMESMGTPAPRKEKVKH